MPVVRRPPVQCFVPPYIVEHMSRSADPVVRERAVTGLAHAAAVRAVRAFAQRMPALLVAPSPTGRRNRLVYDARGRDRLPGTLVLYESPFRVERLLEELQVAMPERRVVLARELTKKFEEWLRGTPAELAAQLKLRPRKGEFVVLIEGGSGKAESAAAETEL